MNITMKLLCAVLEVVVINIIALPLQFDWKTIIWYLLCVAIAFALRLGMEAKKHSLSWQSILIQAVYTVSWVFFTALIWGTWLNYSKGIEVYLFINSLFATFMVTEFEVIFEIGFKRWARKKVSKFLAIEVEEKQEDKP